MRSPMMKKKLIRHLLREQIAHLASRRDHNARLGNDKNSEAEQRCFYSGKSEAYDDIHVRLSYLLSML